MSAKAGYDGRRIGELARIARAHVETVPFYERQEIIHRPAKPSIGMRRYSPEIIRYRRNLPYWLDNGSPVNLRTGAPVRASRNPELNRPP